MSGLSILRAGFIVLAFCFLLTGCGEDSSEDPELYCNSETNHINLEEVNPGTITIDGDPADWAAAGIPSLNSQIDCLANPVPGYSAGVGRLFMTYCEEGSFSDDKYILYMFQYSGGQTPPDAVSHGLFFSPEGHFLQSPGGDDITFEITDSTVGIFNTYDTGTPIPHNLPVDRIAVNEATGVIEVKASVGELEIGGSYPYDPVSLVFYYHTAADSFLEPLGTYWVEF